MAKEKNMATGTIALDPATPAVLGQPLNFIATTSGLHGNQKPRVQVLAYQGGELVYGEARAVGGSVNALPFAPLGGGGSTWLTNGGPAECEATLYFWDNHPSQHQVILATLAFSAAG